MRLMTKRAHARQQVRAEAQLITSGGIHPALLHDLSENGAKLSVTALPVVGMEVEIRWACFTAIGRVAWAEGRECGLEFDHQLDERVVAATQAASVPGQRDGVKTGLGRL